MGASAPHDQPQRCHHTRGNERVQIIQIGLIGQAKEWISRQTVESSRTTRSITKKYTPGTRSTGRNQKVTNHGYIAPDSALGDNSKGTGEQLSAGTRKLLARARPHPTGDDDKIIIISNHTLLFYTSPTCSLDHNNKTQFPRLSVLQPHLHRH